MSDVNASSAAAAPTTVGEPHKTGHTGQDKHAGEKPRSLGTDAWSDLRRNPVFIVSAILIAILLVVSIAPQLFTSKDPKFCDGAFSRLPPRRGAIFGNNLQGCDIFARTIHGARASIMVGFLATVSSLLLGSITGLVAGYFGGKIDTLVSRVTDMFFAIPILLGSIIVLSAFPNTENTTFFGGVSKVTLALSILGWTSMARIMRSSVIQVKQADYVLAARALGASHRRIMLSHILPNSVAPVIVVATIALGGYIGAEATLSFLGIGLPTTVVSWGNDISSAQDWIRVSAFMLLFPGAFLTTTVFAFIMLGDAVRDALDPKLR